MIWTRLPSPIVGLCPMDGVTDPAFRSVVDSIGHPDILFTEFVPADGIVRNIPVLFSTFPRHASSTPLIGQLFGGNPESIYGATLTLCHLGMDGIDINMGCPNRHVVAHGGGASLINDFEKAVKLIKSAQAAIQDFSNGKTVDGYEKREIERRVLPLSVKTRIGYKTIITSDWISNLLETALDAIILHGRLFSHVHSGPVDWEEIHKAGVLCQNSKTILLGNGGIATKKEAVLLSKQYSIHGALIGQASYGNPWAFTDHVPTWEDRVRVAQFHVEQFETLMPDGHPLSLRKHLAWYLKDHRDASNIRAGIMKLTTIEEMKAFLQNI